MGLDLPNIEFRKINKNPTIDSTNSDYLIPFYKNEDYFFSVENLVNFVKSVEKTVRVSNKYSRYIKYLKEDIGLNFCQVTSNITDDVAEVEMHHGPIFTLFDYCLIIVEYMLNTNKKINTFSVADLILKEHFENNIQVVMLSKTVHEEVHERNIFLNYKHAFGDLNKFIQKYHIGLSEDMINKANKYIEYSEVNESFDKGVLDLKNSILKWR
jgi:hypothetical protein